MAWAELRNPILSEPTAAVKDQALVWAEGSWHMVFSYVTNDVPTPGAEHWDIASATSSDLTHWSTPSPWPAQAGVFGVASPDIVRSPAGEFVATYDSNPEPMGGAQPKLFYRTTTDFQTWSAPVPLAPDLHPAAGDRMIDAALAWTGHGLILGYKYGAPGAAGSQHFEIAWSSTGSLDGPWSLVGRPDIVVNGDTVENFEFVAVAGYPIIDQALHGQFAWKLLLLLAAMKILATGLSFLSGTPGGMFAPTLFIGAMLGGAVGAVEHHFFPGLAPSAGTFALVGMGTFFAGFLRVPITSIFM
ncbi:MAG: chloride channel protein, partial [Streptosporangiaceae bacterium]